MAMRASPQPGRLFSSPVRLQPFTTTKGLTVAVAQDRAAMTTNATRVNQNQFKAISY